MTGQPCVYVKDRSCVDVCPEDAPPYKWRELTTSNAAWVEGAEVVDRYVDAYIT